ncbi:MAG TPA: condensation domain-containing protein, partial [Blastocatellia bacterium]|nr:condensation domain-containing protein [Blastocatellia bacterium]
MQLDNVEDIYPLSPMQQGLLFQSLYSASSDVYVRQMACEFNGGFNIPAFKRAWQQVMDRHGILRTAFFWDGLDEPLQVVRQQVPLPWEHLDWRELPAGERQQRLRAYLAADLKRGFDFQEAPVMRMAMIELTADACQFVWSFHHLLLDGWSAQLLLQELFTFYHGFCRDRALNLPRRRAYRDYIGWLERQDLGQAEAYWRQKLQGMKGATRLSIDTGATATAATERRYAEEIITLDRAATEKLNRFAREHKLTLNTVLEGAWALLMSRYSGEREVVFGATVSGRPADLPGIEDMVGLF